MICNYNQVSLLLWWLVTSFIIIACGNPDSHADDQNKVAAENFERL